MADVWDVLQFAPKHAIIALVAVLIVAILGMAVLTSVNGQVPSRSLEESAERSQVLQVAWLTIATVAGIAAEVWLFRHW